MFNKHPMKPETLARRAEERLQQRREQRLELTAGLADKVNTYPLDSEARKFWTELLDEELARQADTPLS